MTSIVSQAPSEPEFDDEVRPQRSKLVHRMQVFLERLIARSADQVAHYTMVYGALISRDRSQSSLAAKAA